MHCAVGIGIVTSDAFAVGVSAVPDPIDQMEWDGWLYHRFFDLHSSEAALGDQQNGLTSIQFEVDSKAMRKVADNMTLMAVVQAVEIGAAVMVAHFDSRLLVKLT